MGDNSPIQAVGIGTIYTVIPSNGSFAKIELRNMLHVLRLRKNLVSWVCLHCNGWGMSHPEEDEMVLSNSKQGDSFKAITKNEQLPLIPLEDVALSSATLCRSEEAAIYLNYIESLATSACHSQEHTVVLFFMPTGVK